MTTTAPARRLTLADDRDPWEKQPGESRQAFDAFAIYRDGSYGRSLLKAGRELTERQLGPRPAEGARRRKGAPTAVEWERRAESKRTQLAEWSTRYRWQDRVDEYDLMVDRRHREATENDRIRRRRIWSGLADVGIRAVAQRMRGDEQDGVEALAPASIESWTEATAVLERLVKVSAFANGEPTDLVKGAFLISPADVVQISRQLVDLALRFIPEPADQDAFIAAVEQLAIGDGSV